MISAQCNCWRSSNPATCVCNIYVVAGVDIKAITRTPGSLEKFTESKYFTKVIQDIEVEVFILKV